MISRRDVKLALCLLLWLPIACFLGYGFVYEPLKFKYLVWRVESARTAKDEYEAFRLAAEYGRVFEVQHITPEEAAQIGRHFDGGWLLRLEWIEASPFIGGAYEAFRSVIDTNNLAVLTREGAVK